MKRDATYKLKYKKSPENNLELYKLLTFRQQQLLPSSEWCGWLSETSIIYTIRGCFPMNFWIRKVGSYEYSSKINVLCEFSEQN